MNVLKSHCGKLNVFQRTMLHWDDLHPYNAVHVVKLFEVLNLQRLNRIINVTLQGHGVTNLKLDEAGRSYHYAGGPAGHQAKLLSSEAELFHEVEQQLNTPFIRDRVFNPFRFFVAPNGPEVWLGMAYFHAIADAESVVRLLQEIAAGYGKSDEYNSTQLDRSFADARAATLGILAKKLCALPSLFKNMRRSCRPAYRDRLNLENRFLYFSMPAESLSALKQTAKAWEVTINDLFLALLIHALAPLARKRARGQRKRLSVGCIVNTRKDLSLESTKIFGLYLGSFIVSCELPPPPDPLPLGGREEHQQQQRTHMQVLDRQGAAQVQAAASLVETMPQADGVSSKCTIPSGMTSPGLRQLAKSVQRQTLPIKKAKLYLGAPLEMLFGRLMLTFFSTERRKKLYQKHYPLWGGITNMNLNPLWPQNNERPFDYFRAVSTGPVTPLVLSLTTVGNHINVGASFRSTVFSPDEIEAIKRSFLEEVAQLAAQA